jgi:hemoglobin-like flavoprotein
MGKKKLNGTSPNGEGLKLGTLATTFESARMVAAVTQIGHCSTYQHLARALLTVTKNKDQLKILYHALEQLDASVCDMGNTTLIKPLDHPLVHRHLLPADQEK